MNARAKTVALRAIACAAIAAASSVMAADYTTYIVGNSLSVDLMNHFRYAANTYEQGKGNTYHWGQQYRPSTTLTYLHDNSTDAGQTDANQMTTSAINLTYTQGLPGQWSDAQHTTLNPNRNNSPWTVALPNNRFDGVILEPFKSNATQLGSNDPYYCTLGSDTNAVNDIVSTTRNAPENINAAAKFFIYAAWPLNDASPINNTQFQARFMATTDNTDGQLGVLTRDYYRNLCNRARSANPTASISVIPVGEVYYKLSQQMQAGAYTNSGLTSISQLYRDQYHSNFLGQDIIAWTTYATLFKTSPVGLDAGPSSLTNTIAPNYSEFLTTSLKPEDKTAIQQTIWDVVSKEQLVYTNVPEPAAVGVLGVAGSAVLCTRRRK